MASAPGWYSDPTGKAELRYWDGNAWTERTKARTENDDDGATSKQPIKANMSRPRPRSEICITGWTWTDSRATDRRTRKDFPYELWFVAYALGPNGLYTACESSRTFYTRIKSYYQKGPTSPRGSLYVITRDEYSEASFNDLVKQLWDTGWEPTSGGTLWHEYRFRRTVSA